MCYLVFVSVHLITIQNNAQGTSKSSKVYFASKLPKKLQRLSEKDGMKNPQSFLFKFMVFSRSDFARFFFQWNLIFLTLGSLTVQQTLAACTPQGIYITGVLQKVFYL